MQITRKFSKNNLSFTDYYHIFAISSLDQVEKRLETEISSIVNISAGVLLLQLNSDKEGLNIIIAGSNRQPDQD